MRVFGADAEKPAPTPPAWMISPAPPPTTHASGVDDGPLPLVPFPSPVPGVGPVSRALLGHSCQAPRQLHSLREECRWTVEELANKTRLSVRSVHRHLAGKPPLDRNITAYERAFSKQLKRQVVINKMA